MIIFKAQMHSYGKNHEMVVDLLRKTIEANASHIELTVITKDFRDGYSEGFKEGTSFCNKIIIDETLS